VLSAATAASPTLPACSCCVTSVAKHEAGSTLRAATHREEHRRPFRINAGGWVGISASPLGRAVPDVSSPAGGAAGRRQKLPKGLPPYLARRNDSAAMTADDANRRGDLVNPTSGPRSGSSPMSRAYGGRSIFTAPSALRRRGCDLRHKWARLCRVSCMLMGERVSTVRARLPTSYSGRPPAGPLFS
jgi:hypothetical protein